MRLAIVALAAVVVAVAVAAWLATRDGSRAAERRLPTAVVARVADGDTLRLRDGTIVRLVQIDAPELGGGECYARAAWRELASIVGSGDRVELEVDPRVHAYGGGGRLDLDKVDRFGRLLAYVHADGENVNLTLVRRGAAAPWFFAGVRGRYARQLEDAAGEARTARRGAWGACPRARLDATRPFATD